MNMTKKEGNKLSAIYLIANNDNLIEISIPAEMAGMSTDYFVATFKSLQ